MRLASNVVGYKLLVPQSSLLIALLPHMATSNKVAPTLVPETHRKLLPFGLREGSSPHATVSRPMLPGKAFQGCDRPAARPMLTPSTEK